MIYELNIKKDSIVDVWDKIYIFNTTETEYKEYVVSDIKLDLFHTKHKIQIEYKTDDVLVWAYDSQFCKNLSWNEWGWRNHFYCKESAELQRQFRIDALINKFAAAKEEKINELSDIEVEISKLSKLLSK